MGTMTWQQQQEQRYLDRLRERWNEDGTRKLIKRPLTYIPSDEDVKQMAKMMQDAARKFAVTPSPLWKNLCNQ